MIHVITSSTHHFYRDAVAQARTVPGLEAELVNVRDLLATYQAQHSADQERLTLQERARDEDARTIESLQGQLALLRAAIAQTAGVLAGDRDPKSAAYRTAETFLTHADLFGISDTTGQAAPLAALRELATPRPVYLLLRNGSLVSAHFTLPEAKQEAIRRGADPASWDVSDPSPEGALAAYHAAWCISGRQLDAAAPWMTLGATPSSVFVVREPSGLPYSVHSTEATARRLAADAGIPVTDRSLIRVTVSPALSPAAVAWPRQVVQADTGQLQLPR